MICGSDTQHSTQTTPRFCFGPTSTSEQSIPRGKSEVYLQRGRSNLDRLFARGYLGPNSTFADIYAIDSKATGAAGNSLATSDQCPNFEDASGGDYATTWDSIYLPPITKRLNRLIHGNLTLTDSQVSIFPYLCGFESQITGSISPFCDIFTKKEILEYEYRQDLRYYYGTGREYTLPFLKKLE